MISFFGIVTYCIFGGTEINGKEYNVDLFPPQIRIEKIDKDNK